MYKIPNCVKNILLLAVVTVAITALLCESACAGWKENYRNKYSKKTLDPASEKAKKIRRLCNPSVKLVNWQDRLKEKRAQGIEPKRTLTDNLMPWKSEKKNKDKFGEYATNFTSKAKDLPEENRPKSGYTLTGCVKTFGKTVGTEVKDIHKKILEQNETK